MDYNFETGEVLLIDKPIGWTSFDVVNHLRVLARKHLRIQRLKAGHAGTLDPLATGLLIVCTGKMTKQIQLFQDQDKTYTGTLKLGQTTPSYDLETEVDAVFDIASVTDEDLHKATYLFKGEISQLPPRYSAIKIDGKRAFDYARSKQEVALVPRKVTITRFELIRIEKPEVDFIVECTKGTYIRSLAHDFGKALNNGACLTALRRTRIGNFDVAQAKTIDELRQFFQEEGEKRFPENEGHNQNPNKQV